MSTSGELRMAADELDVHLAGATAGPWRLSTTMLGSRYSALVAPVQHAERYRRADGRQTGWEWDDVYGGCLVGESIMSADRVLLATLRNAAGHLPAMLRALADEDPHAAAHHGRALAREILDVTAEHAPFPKLDDVA